MSPLTAHVEPFNFTSGVILGVPFVTIGINVQTAATFYANSFLFTPLPNNSYVSLDIPYCNTNITYTCVNRIIFGIRKLGACTLLMDRDLSNGDPVAGRLFIYPNPDPPCNGDATVTFLDVTLVPAINGSLYSYDIEGISTGILKSETAAIFEYRNGECPYSDGALADVSEGQWVCDSMTLQCASPRPVNTDIITPAPLYARYRCLGSPAGGGPNSLYQVISPSYPPTGIETEFDITWFSNISNSFIPLSNYTSELIKPGIIRQFIVFNPNIYYTVFTAFGGFNYTNNGTATMFPLPFIYLPQIQCICNFSMVCIDGVVDLDENGTLFYPNNQFPIALANTSTPIVRRGDEALLQDAGSNDPDMYPQQNITYLWIQGQSIDNINISIVDDTSPNASFTTYPFLDGTYTMVLVVSDGQDLNFTDVNVTAVDIFPTCNGTLQVTEFENTTVYLNASLSFDPGNVTLNVTWIEISGFPVDLINSTELVASFFANQSGIYIFQANATNGLKNCTFQVIVTVMAAPMPPLNDTNTSLPPVVIPPNRTLPPADVNFTDIPVVSDAPIAVTEPPSTFVPTPTGSPPFFPPIPGPPSVGYLIAAWMIMAFFLGLGLILILWAWMEYTPEDNHYILKNPYIIRKFLG